MAIRPDKFPEWAIDPSVDPVVGGPNVLEPSQQKKEIGWEREELPPANIQNWLHNLTNQWLEYIDEIMTDISPKTGDVKWTIKENVVGWLLVSHDGTIGNAASAGTLRANADTQDLFVAIWDECIDANCPVSGGPRGASALDDFNDDKTIGVPKIASRVVGGTGQGTGLTLHTNGESTGAETEGLTAAHNGPHTHDFDGITPVGAPTIIAAGTDYLLGDKNASTDSSGTGEPHNNLQPTVFLHAHMKL